MKNESILNQILIDGISHFDNIKRTKIEENLLDESIKFESELKKRLSSISAELSQLYNKTENATANFYCEQINSYYIQGFKLGFIMCLEILDYKSNIHPQ